MSPTQLAEPLRKRYKPIVSLPELRLHLQWAAAVELSTIPPYLCALYSVEDAASAAATLVRSVAIEEMLHLMLVSNLMNSVGASPKLSGEFVPQYPTYIPHHAAGGPYIQLQALSPALAASTFMAIEQPEASPHVPAEGDYFKTIGQFYKAIERGFEHLAEKHGEDWLFRHDTGFQRSDTYFGSGAGHLIVVHDLASAKLAIQEITEQGEGAAWPQPTLPGEEPFGGFDHYGPRLDGTYGPILGTPWELSHYFKFQQIATGQVATPPVYPMQANPSSDDLEGEIRQLSELFDASYGLVLSSLEKAFGAPAGQVDFFAVAFPVMHFVLPSLARLLMQTALHPQADPTLGPTAGPGFAVRTEPLAEMVRQAGQLLAAPPGDRGGDYGQLWVQTLGPVTQVLQDAARKAGTEIL